MTSAPYHHGDLRHALVDAATDLARQGGPEAVVLREAARQVGVSHNAGYRHFANRDDLLGAVAERAMAVLAHAMEVALSEVPDISDPAALAKARLRAVGLGYIRFALSEPGLFRTAFFVSADPSVSHGPDATGTGGLEPYEMLLTCIEDLVASGALPPERRANTELVAWSTVHGLASLVLEGPLKGLQTEMIEAAYCRAADIIDRGL